MRELKINGIYKHFKGDYYIVEDIANHSETKEKYVVYRRLYGDMSLWIREDNMFHPLCCLIHTEQPLVLGDFLCYCLRFSHCKQN